MTSISAEPDAHRVSSKAFPNDHLTAALGRPYTADVLSAPTEIEQLAESVHRLTPGRDDLVEPRFFLASVSADWTPRVVVVRRGDVIVGIVYAKERRIASFPTGIVYGDGRLANLVVAEAADREDILIVGIRTLFAMPGVRAVRLALPPGSVEAEAVGRAHALEPFDVGYGTVPPFDAHARLPLPCDYQQFLGFLGRKTRHNFRYYRRRFDAAGHAYVHDLSLHELRRAATDLRRKCRIPIRRRAIDRAVNLLEATERPWAAGLRHRDGEWLSVAGGWFSGARAFLFLQVNNDRDHDVASLSVVLRAHLIEALIRSGTPDLVFWSGAAPPLSRYASPMPAMMVCLDAPAPGWRLVRSLIGRTQAWMPRRMAADVRWMTSAGVSLEPPASLPGRNDRPD